MRALSCKLSLMEILEVPGIPAFSSPRRPIHCRAADHSTLGGFVAHGVRIGRATSRWPIRVGQRHRAGGVVLVNRCRSRSTNERDVKAVPAAEEGLTLSVHHAACGVYGRGKEGTGLCGEVVIRLPRHNQHAAGRRLVLQEQGEWQSKQKK